MDTIKDPLLSPKVEAKIAQIHAEQDRRDAIGRRAANDPLPGPAADAFAVQPCIQVGSYMVQPFLDRHFQLLKALDNGLYRMMATDAAEDFQPLGPDAWELYWMMTRPVAVTRDLLRAGKVTEFKAAAEAEFAELPMAALMQLCLAVRKQIEISWNPALAYGAPSEGKQGGPPS